jgi:hypothetical protein
LQLQAENVLELLHMNKIWHHIIYRMGKFDAQLRNYLSNMGFQVQNDDLKRVDDLLKAIIYHLICNIMTNILSIVQNTKDTNICSNHILATGRICRKCVQHASSTPGTGNVHQGGGDMSLPQEYYSGVLTPQYQSTNFNNFQTTGSSAEFVRQGLDISMAGGNSLHSGGKPSDLKDYSFIRGFIEFVCIKKYLRDNRMTRYKISSGALEQITLAVHENILIFFDHVYQMLQTCKVTSNSQCLLNLRILVDTLKSEKFSFLH